MLRVFLKATNSEPSVCCRVTALNPTSLLASPPEFLRSAGLEGTNHFHAVCIVSTVQSHRKSALRFA